MKIPLLGSVIAESRCSNGGVRNLFPCLGSAFLCVAFYLKKSLSSSWEWQGSLQRLQAFILVQQPSGKERTSCLVALAEVPGLALIGQDGSCAHPWTSHSDWPGLGHMTTHGAMVISVLYTYGGRAEGEGSLPPTILKPYCQGI